MIYQRVALEWVDRVWSHRTKMLTLPHRDSNLSVPLPKAQPIKHQSNLQPVKLMISIKSIIASCFRNWQFFEVLCTMDSPGWSLSNAKLKILKIQFGTTKFDFGSKFWCSILGGSKEMHREDVWNFIYTFRGSAYHDDTSQKSNEHVPAFFGSHPHMFRPPHSTVRIIKFGPVPNEI